MQIETGKWSGVVSLMTLDVQSGLFCHLFRVRSDIFSPEGQADKQTKWEFTPQTDINKRSLSMSPWQRSHTCYFRSVCACPHTSLKLTIKFTLKILPSSGCIHPSLRWHLLRALPRVRTWGQSRCQVSAQAQEAHQSVHLHPRLRPNAALPIFLQICHDPQLRLRGKTSVNHWLGLCWSGRRTCSIVTSLENHRSDLLSSPSRSLQLAVRWQPCTLHMDWNTDMDPPPQRSVSSGLHDQQK